MCRPARGGARCERRLSVRHGGIDVSAVDANNRRAGNQEFRFLEDRSFTGEAGQLRYADGLLAGDVNGDRRADFEVMMANRMAPSAAFISL